MSIVLNITDSYEVASIAGVVDDPKDDYYRKCGIISKENLEAIIGDNKVEYTENSLYYAIEDYDDNELETDDDFDYIIDIFANNNFDHNENENEDEDDEYWVMAKCKYIVKFTELVTAEDIRQLKAYIVRATNINEQNIEETHE